MVHKRKMREQDEFPQQLQDGFICSAVTGDGGVDQSAIVQTEWTMPVELDLNHPIFMECSKLFCTQDVPNVNVVGTNTIAGAPAYVLIREVKIMKEARGTTTWPLDSDRATLHTFRLQTVYYGLTTSTVGINFSEMEQSAQFEDAKTGYGELIAQPRLYVLSRTTVNQAGAATAGAIGSKELFLSMHYRLTDRIHGTEYLTELIAKFT